jgi:hypothetical protein
MKSTTRNGKKLETLIGGSKTIPTSSQHQEINSVANQTEQQEDWNMKAWETLTSASETNDGNKILATCTEQKHWPGAALGEQAKDEIRPWKWSPAAWPKRESEPDLCSRIGHFNLKTDQFTQSLKKNSRHKQDLSEAR